MSETPAILSPLSESLRRDLSLVLPLDSERRAAPGNWSRERAEETAAKIDASRSPAFVGLGDLSIESARWVIALAEKVRGKLLPSPLPSDLSLGFPVTQTASLAYVFASDLIIWVGCTGGDGPIAQAIAERQLRAAFVEPTLDAVQNLRADFANGAGAPHDAKRVGVVLGPSCDARVASQWHKLAAQVQQRFRVAVIRLPNIATFRNTRGVLEAITWQTGLSCASGGVDFADGVPRPCAPVEALRERHTIDEFRFEGITVPSAARVMRFDGVVLWLCDDPKSAPPDPVAAFIEAVYHRVRRPA